MTRHTCIICGKKRNAEYMQKLEPYGQGWRYVCVSMGSWDTWTGLSCKQKHDKDIFRKMSESQG